MASSLGLCDESYCMVFGGLFRFLAFQDPAKVYIEHLVHGEVVVTLEGGCFMSSVTQLI